jgi:plastocyanin
MRGRIPVALFLFVFASAAFAKDVYLSIGGEVGNFFTDARILNPSFDKDIVISARYLQNNQDNSGVAAVNVTVPKRTMLVLDNVVSTIFHSSGIGAVRLTSDDDFVATQRIYAREAAGTLGQFVPGLDATTALKKGALIQLKQNATFRTNLGGANPNAAVANVTFKLYDKNNAVVVTKTFALQPFGVLTPSRIDSFFGGTNDLSDSWISFDSDQPVFMYGSVVDNGTTDPTFITASPDTGNAPPPPAVKTVTVVASDFKYVVTGGTGLAAKDQVKFVLSSSQNTHGFQLVSPDGAKLIDIPSLTGATIERTVTLPQAGTYFYFCTFTECGTGHTTMSGEISVGDARDPGGNPRY